MRKLFATPPSWVLMVQRLVVAVVMFAHGAQKLFGWFGGYGFNATMNYFTQRAHIAAPLAFLDILAESVGAFLLFFGLGSRIMSLAISVIMVVAVLMVHIHNGFFMDWAGGKPEGFEYHLLMLALTVPLIIKGGGLWSVDRAVARERRSEPLRTEERRREGTGTA
jgi:putative oxidoreductase